MMKSLKYVAAAGALGAAAALATAPANAQLGPGVGLDTDVDVGVGVKTSDPHPRHRHETFQYTWEDGERVRYDTTFCYNDRGRRFEPEGVRAVVKVR